MLRQDDDDKIDILVCSSNCTEEMTTFKDNLTFVEPLKNDEEIGMVAYAGASSSGSSLSNEGSSSSKISLTPKSISATAQKNKDSPQACLKCPRCDSGNTKFCYYNNYNHHQPRYFCKSCRRYWTEGGALRNVPIGGGCRKNKRVKHRTTFMTTTGGIFEPSSYLEDNDVNMLARLNTKFPCFGGPTNFGDDNNRVSFNMDTLSSLNETMYATHLGSSPSFLDMGPLVNNCATRCTTPQCAGINLCNCAFYMNSLDKTLDANSGCDMPVELLEQGTYSTFYDQSNPVMMGGLTSSAPIEDQLSSVSNVLPLSYLAPDICNATIFDPFPQVQELPDQEHIPSTHLLRQRENISLAQYYEDSKNIAFEQIKKDEESTFFNQAPKGLASQVLFDGHDDQPCHDQPNALIKDFSEADNKTLLEGLAGKEMVEEQPTIDVPSTNEKLLTNGPHSNASWGHLRWQDMQVLGTTPQTKGGI